MQTQIGDISFNKNLAKNCLDMIFNQKQPAQAAAQYLAENYRQHNPDAPDGPQGVIEYATSYIKANPELRLEFKRIIAEGDMVVVHSHLKPNPNVRGFAVVDIFRVADHKLAEHWDVMQPIPERTVNRNGMF